MLFLDVVFSHVKVWSRTLRAEGVTPKEKGADKAEAKARAAFAACVCSINAVDSLSYRFAEVRKARVADFFQGWSSSWYALVAFLRDLMPKVAVDLILGADGVQSRGRGYMGSQPSPFWRECFYAKDPDVHVAGVFSFTLFVTVSIATSTTTARATIAGRRGCRSTPPTYIPPV